VGAVSCTVQCIGPGGCQVHELADCTRDPAPDRHAGSIPDLSEFIGPSRAFRLGLVAVALEHQVSDVPDVDLRYHDGKATRLTSTEG